MGWEKCPKITPSDSERPGVFKSVFLCLQGGDSVFGGSLESEDTTGEGSCLWLAILGENSWVKSTRRAHWADHRGSFRSVSKGLKQRSFQTQVEEPWMRDRVENVSIRRELLTLGDYLKVQRWPWVGDWVRCRKDPGHWGWTPDPQISDWNPLARAPVSWETFLAGRGIRWRSCRHCGGQSPTDVNTRERSHRNRTHHTFCLQQTLESLGLLRTYTWWKEKRPRTLEISFLMCSFTDN